MDLSTKRFEGFRDGRVTQASLLKKFSHGPQLEMYHTVLAKLCFLLVLVRC